MRPDSKIRFPLSLFFIATRALRIGVLYLLHALPLGFNPNFRFRREDDATRQHGPATNGSDVGRSVAAAAAGSPAAVPTATSAVDDAAAAAAADAATASRRLGASAAAGDVACHACSLSNSAAATVCWRLHRHRSRGFF